MAPPHQPNKNEYPDPAAFFQQMMGGFDPNRSGATGRGVDHSGADNTTNNNNANYPTFWPGFPFGRPPHPPGPPGADHPRPPSPPAPPGPGPVPPPPPPPDHGRHGRHRHHHPPGAWSWGGSGGGGGGWGDWDGGNDGDFHFGDGHRHGRHGGRHGRRGRHNHDGDEEGTREKPVDVSGDEKNNEKSSSDEKRATRSGDEKTGSPDTVRDDVPDPDEMVPEYEEAANNKNEAFTGGWGGFGGHGWGGRRGRGGFGGAGRGDWHRGFGGRRHHPDRRSCHFNTAPFGTDAGPGSNAGPNAFSFPDMMRGFMSHPFLQHMSAAARNYSGNADGNNTTENHDDVDSFSPPVDLFNTATAYVLHVALPGVKREDVGVHWDPEHGTLSVSGVVHRPGDEAFLQTLHSAERRVGVFEKKITLPPRDLSAAQEQSREEIDAEGIAAKLDDGVLVIIVPKMEKEWTEVRKVDIL
ncbi:HSP20-like chaperone [Akanthomyces lecanii RCEF 1005]|uniref:HSP20-like chaperone n=1 Tax=Akanthomyces lecanii RCEF 1005 TaxID=1081108 RepID=A0A168KZQ4_CORDF|nr:HSP20-like chaperone [Akanthomyces lecanii RCEF 1005]